MAAAWDVFIAYASVDRRFADALYAALRRLPQRPRVFLDHEALRPGDDWPQVLARALAASRCVVALISPASPAAFFQREEILRALDAARAIPRRQRLVPVFVDGARPDSEEVPYGLRPLHALVASTADELDRVATEVADLLRHDDDGVTATDAGAQDETRRVAAQITAHMATLRRDVQQLTEEQFRAIQQLRWLRRVRISGCAGSGKTLVAAEKAARLAHAGQRVLFLCHNPLLAEHVRSLLAGCGARCLAFGAWVDEIAAAERDNAAYGGQTGSGWSHLLEPDGATLAAALLQLQAASGMLDAVIVDEAQDFRDAWWPLVEAALRHRPEGTLYLFHDDQQTLLPRRGSYPVDEPRIDLSRNCRNAGRVYELMRRFDDSAPRTDMLLRDQGRVQLRAIETGHEREALAAELQLLELDGLVPSTTVLWSGVEPVEACPVAGLVAEVGSAVGWQDEVRRRLQTVHDYAKDSKALAGPRLPPLTPVQALAGLSRAAAPDANDVALVQDYARQFQAPFDSGAAGRRMLKFGWVAEGGVWRLQRTMRDQGPFERVRALLRFFQIDGWADGIGTLTAWRVTPFFELPREAAVPLFAVGDFKGLEADVVVLVMRGKTMAHRSSTYVGISRARAVLIVLADPAALSVFPRDHVWG